MNLNLVWQPFWQCGILQFDSLYYTRKIYRYFHVKNLSNLSKQIGSPVRLVSIRRCSQTSTFAGWRKLLYLVCGISIETVKLHLQRNYAM